MLAPTPHIVASQGNISATPATEGARPYHYYSDPNRLNPTKTRLDYWDQGCWQASTGRSKSLRGHLCTCPGESWSGFKKKKTKKQEQRSSALVDKERLSPFAISLFLSVTSGAKQHIWQNFRLIIFNQHSIQEINFVKIFIYLNRLSLCMSSITLKFGKAPHFCTSKQQHILFHDQFRRTQINAGILIYCKSLKVLVCMVNIFFS